MPCSISSSCFADYFMRSPGRRCLLPVAHNTGTVTPSPSLGPSLPAFCADLQHAGRLLCKLEPEAYFFAVRDAVARNFTFGHVQCLSCCRVQLEGGSATVNYPFSNRYECPSRYQANAFFLDLPGPGTLISSTSALRHVDDASRMHMCGKHLQVEAGDAERAETWFADMEAAGFRHDLQAGLRSDVVGLLRVGLLSISSRNLPEAPRASVAGCESRLCRVTSLCPLK